MKRLIKRTISLLITLVMLVQIMPVSFPSSAANELIPNGMTFSVEASGNTFTIKRSSGEGQVRIVYRTVSMTALEGIHLNHTEGNLIFRDGEDSKTVTVTEMQSSDIPELYRYQSGTYREYRFEVLDTSYSLLAYTVRKIDYGTAYRFTNANVNTDIPELAYMYGYFISTDLASGKYVDVSAPETSNYTRIEDKSGNGYTQGVWSIPTESALNRGGIGSREYLSAIGDKLYATVYFTMIEVDDGYQYIQILTDNEETCDARDGDGTVSTPVTSVYKACFDQDKDTLATSEEIMIFPHLTDAVNRAAEPERPNGQSKYYHSEFPSDYTYMHKQAFRNSSFRAETSNALALDPTTESLNIRFNARGSGDDTWKFKDLKARFAIADTKAPEAIGIYPQISNVGYRKSDMVSVTVVFSEIVKTTDAVLVTSWGDLYCTTTSGSYGNALTFTGKISANANTQLQILGYQGTICDMSGLNCADIKKTLQYTVTDVAPQISGGVMKISNSFELMYFADYLSQYPGTSASLICDIDMVCTELTRYTAAAAYGGTFDGCGHTIRGLTNLKDLNGFNGLFSKVTRNAVIRNLNIEVKSAPTPDYFASLAGYNEGLIDRCSADVYISRSYDDPGVIPARYMAGLVSINFGTIRDSVVTGSINTYWEDVYFGGITVDNLGTVEGCLFAGTFYTFYHSSTTRGGVCCINRDNGVIRNCCDAVDSSAMLSAPVGINYGTAENTEQLSRTALASGEVCYLLNGGVTDGDQTWYQNIDNKITTDTMPSFTGGTVYYTGNSYTNTPYLITGENSVPLTSGAGYVTYRYISKENGWHSFYSTGANVDAILYDTDGKYVISKDADSTGGDFVCAAYLRADTEYTLKLRIYSGMSSKIKVTAEPSRTLYTVSTDVGNGYITNCYVYDRLYEVMDEESIQAPEGALIQADVTYPFATAAAYCTGYSITNETGAPIPSYEINGSIFEFRMPASNVTVKPLSELYRPIELGNRLIYLDSGTSNFSFTPEESDYYNFSASHGLVELSVFSSSNQKILNISKYASSSSVWLDAGEHYLVKVFVEEEGTYLISIDYAIPKYSLVINEYIDHGTVTANKYNLEAGEKVELEVTPEEGYAFDEYTFTDEVNEPLDINLEYDAEKEVYYFLMPSENISLNVTFTPETAPTFRHGLLLSDEIGVKFRISFPNGVDPSGSYVEFTAADGRTATVTYEQSVAITDSTDRYFYFFINALELAENITATLHYGDGKTVTDTYAAMDYIEYVQENMTDSEKLLNIVNALQAYGYYMQQSGWTDDKPEHTPIPAPATLITAEDVTSAVEALDGFTIIRDFGTSGIKDISIGLTMNEKTRINITVQLDREESAPDGAEIVRKDGEVYCKFHIDKIGPKNLGTEYVREIDTVLGKATVKVSAMAYVKALLESGTLNGNQELAMAAYYSYWQAAVNY